MLPIKPGEGGIKTVILVNGVELRLLGMDEEELKHKLSIAVSEERYEDAQKLKESIDKISRGVSTDFVI